MRPDFERVAKALRSHGVAAEAAGLWAAEARAKRELDQPPTGKRATDQERGWLYFNLILQHAGIPRSSATDAALLELKAWHDQHNLWDSVPEGVGRALKAFRRAGLSVAVVSNANGTVRALLDRLDFLDFFEVVVDSAEEGMEKPDPRIFGIALQRIGAQPEDALHVGDLYEIDVVGARAAGIRPVLVDEASLYPEADCPRVHSLRELAAHLVPETGRRSGFLLDSGTAQ